MAKRRYNKGPYIKRHANGVFYWHHGKRVRSLGTRDEQEAEQLRQQFEGAGSGSNPGAEGQEVRLVPLPPLPEIIDEFLDFVFNEKRENRDAPGMRYRVIKIGEHLASEGLNLRDVDKPVTRKQLCGLRNRKEQKVSRATWNRYLDAWMVFFKWALEKKYIRELPFERAELYYRNEGNRHKEDPIPAPDEVFRVIQAAQHGYASAFTLMADTGIRYEECYLLDADDVQLPSGQMNGVIKIQPKYLSSGQIKRLPDGGQWMPKGAKERTIQVPPRVVQAALEWIGWKAKVEGGSQWGGVWESCRVCQTTTQRHAAKGLCRKCYARLDYRRRHGLLTELEDQLLSTPSSHRDLSDAGMNKVLKKACNATGVQRITLHTLRSFRASTLAHEEKWDLERIRRYMGHESVATTERYIRVIGKAKVPRSILDLGDATTKKSKKVEKGRNRRRRVFASA